MNEKQWEAAARELAQQHASRITMEMLEKAELVGLAYPLVADLRRALVEVDRLLRFAPTPVQQRYKRLPESELREAGIEAQSNLDDGSLRWLDLSDVTKAAAAQVRALDEALFQYRDRGKPTDASRDFLCEATRVHVIPRASAHQPAAADIGTPTYRRRGLFRHRLLPEEIGGYAIKLFWFKDLSLSFRKKEGKVVSAIFEGLSLTPREDFVNFVASAAPCAHEDSSLAAQVKSAYAGDVIVAVWPELTMPVDRRSKLANLLAVQAKLNPPATGPRFIAAGSWHELHDGKVRNRMHILSNMGLPRFWHDKSLPLESRSLGVEELEPSYEVPVLIAEDALIGFAICRDFCEGQISKVYSELDVDLVIVPSYGDAKTIHAHCHQANAVSMDLGTRAFVVQQVVPGEVEASGAGYVLPPGVDAGKALTKDLITDPPGTTHPISFRKV